MKKSTKIIILLIVIAVVIAIIAALIFTSLKQNKEESKLNPVSTPEDLSKLIDTVYENNENLLSTLETREIDLSDLASVKSVSGLDTAENVDFIVASEPMISSQAYSFVLAKVKDGVDANKVAKEIFDGVNPRKWICVTAEKVYATSSGNIACLVMSSEELAKPVYDKFKELAVNIGEEYTKEVYDTVPENGITEIPQ